VLPIQGTIKQQHRAVLFRTDHYKTHISCAVLYSCVSPCDMTATATQLPPCVCRDLWFISAAMWKRKGFLNFADATFHREVVKVVSSFSDKLWVSKCLLTHLNSESFYGPRTVRGTEK
jgi:hypothetical protein